MKLYGEYKRRSVNEAGNLELTFEITDWKSKRDAEGLNKTVYSMELKEPKSKRSLSQNALLWALISEISLVENGNKNEESEMAIYCNLLEMTGAKCQYFECTEEAYEDLRQTFRVCRIRDRRNHNGVNTVMVKAYIGSSKFKKNEMAKLLDKAIEYAEALEINTAYWINEYE